MVVDDMIFNLQAIEFLLQDYGNYLNLYSFFESQECINFYKTTHVPIHLVLMDIDMPDKNGITVLNQLIEFDINRESYKPFFCFVSSYEKKPDYDVKYEKLHYLS